MRLYMNTLQGTLYLNHFMGENGSQVQETECEEGEQMEDPMADDFLSYMVYFFKALFLKTLKFQLCRHCSLRLVDEF